MENTAMIQILESSFRLELNELEKFVFIFFLVVQIHRYIAIPTQERQNIIIVNLKWKFIASLSHGYFNGGQDFKPQWTRL